MKKKKFTLFDKLILPGTLFLLGMLVLSVLAGNVDPRENNLLPFFGLAFPYIFLANVVVLFFWLLRRKWAIALVLLLVMGYGHRSVRATFGLFGNQGKATQKAAGSVRILTYNVHNFVANKEDRMAGGPLMIELVKSQKADIVCFQEFYVRLKGNAFTMNEIKKQLGLEYHSFYPTNEAGKRASAIGMVIFSRYPIVSYGHIPFPNTSGGNACIYADVQIEGKVIRIYNVHLQSISFNQEDYDDYEKITTQMDYEKKSLTRMASMLGRAFKKRSFQVDILKQHMRSCEIPFILTGDFNDTPASYSVRQLTNELHNAFMKQGTGLGKTYNGLFPNFQIDYIAGSKEWEVKNYAILRDRLSDHFPVRSDLQLLK